MGATPLESGGNGARGLAGDPLRAEAAELDNEAAQHVALARAKRHEAAKLRSRAERLDDPSRGVPPAPTARERVRNDGLLAAASEAVETLPDGFIPKDLATALGIRDEPRALKLLMALADWGKVARLTEGWRSVDTEEARVRDYIREHPTFTFADLCLTLELSQSLGSAYVDHFKAAGLLTGEGGHYTYVDVPARPTPARPRRRPPEQDPPAGTESPKRGMPVYTPNHGERGRLAQRGGRHRMKQRDARREAMEKAKEERRDRQRRKGK